MLLEEFCLRIGEPVAPTTHVAFDDCPSVQLVPTVTPFPAVGRTKLFSLLVPGFSEISSEFLDWSINNKKYIHTKETIIYAH